MVKIATRYLGLGLRSPLVPSASPLSETLGGVRALEDAGAGAIVLYSLFEEQLTLPPEVLHQLMGRGAGGYAEAVALRSSAPRVQNDPLGYLEHVRTAKEAVDCPIIASANGAPDGAWPHYAKLLAEAGADAIELNLYHIPTDPEVSAADLEDKYFHVVRSVKEVVDIPLAVKLHPFFTSLPHAARRFHENGADGLVLFNRFYQPDVDLDRMRARSSLALSTSEDMRLPLRWVSVLHRRTGADLALTGGVHSAEDALKAIAAGAQVAMVCSVLLRHGIPHLKTLNERLRIWLEARDFPDIDALRGRLHESEEVQAVIERAQYMRVLRDYEVS
jgi:dihydroorotate dehydrogenase (fumarate)